MKINSKDIVLVSIQLVLFIVYTFPVAWSLEFFSWFKIKKVDKNPLYNDIF